MGAGIPRAEDLRRVRLVLALIAVSVSGIHAASAQEADALREREPLKVEVYPLRLQEKVLLYDEYREKVPADRRDPLREAELATGIAADLLATGHREEAAAFLRKARDELTHSADPVRNALARADIEHALGHLAGQDGAFEARTRHLLAAEAALKEAFPDDHPIVLAARIRAANAEFEQGFARFIESGRKDMVFDALRRLRRVAETAGRKFGPTSPQAVQARLALVVGSAVLNRNQRALREIDELAARLDERDEEQRFLKAAALSQKAKLLNWLDRKAEAAETARQAMALLKPEEVGGPVAVEEFTPEEYGSGEELPGLRRRVRMPGVGAPAGGVSVPGGITGDNDVAGGGVAPATGITPRDFASPTSGSWVLIGLCIDADGGVAQAEMLDHGGPSRTWAENAFKLASQRRYLPMPGLKPGECAPQMIRLAEVSERQEFLGSRIRLRSKATRIQLVDLAKDNPLSGGYVAAGLAAEEEARKAGGERTETSGS